MAKPVLPSAVAPDLLARLQERFHPWPLLQDWDLTIDGVAPGAAELSLRPGPRTVNGRRGNLNGGVLATMADMVGAMALSTAFDGAMPFATSDLHVRYLEPALGPAVATASVLRLSRAGAVVEARIHCADKLVVAATMNFSIKPNLAG
ncbi:MAG TPA: PaaI family thioesterase [Holophagaceae bacterium]|nr:PaaI family thioesterase [Holophagaceae bacterium]